MRLVSALAIFMLALSIVSFADPAVVLVGQGNATSDDAVAAFADMTTIPVPSSSDMVNGNAGFQIDSRSNHGGTAIDLAAFTDGAATTVYPGQLPNDYPGVGTPCVSIGYDLGSAQDVGSVIVYGYNWNSGNGPNDRSLAPFAVYTTTDATVNASSTWTLVQDYVAPSGILPASVEWYTGDVPPASWDPYLATGIAGAVCIADTGSVALASSVTGVRVDVYCAGFGNQLRDAANTGADTQAVASPFIAEIDVLDLIDTQSFYLSVEDWAQY